MTARAGVAEGTHHGVPGFPVRIAAKEDETVGESAVGILVIPKCDVFAEVDIIRGGIFDEGTVGCPVAADIVGIWEVGDCEDVVPCNAATSIDEDSLIEVRDIRTANREDIPRVLLHPSQLSTAS